MSQRKRRHAVIAELLSAGPVANQDALAERLGAEGLAVTQATLSRDLRELGAVKGPKGYALAATYTADQSKSAEEQLAAALVEHARDIIPAASLVVIRTGPGRAQIVAVHLDACRLLDVAGTVAGDDTIFVATRSARAAADLARALRSIARLGPRTPIAPNPAGS